MNLLDLSQPLKLGDIMVSSNSNSEISVDCENNGECLLCHQAGQHFTLLWCYC